MPDNNQKLRWRFTGQGYDFEPGTATRDGL